MGLFRHAGPDRSAELTTKPGIQKVLKELDSGWSLPRTWYGAGMTASYESRDLWRDTNYRLVVVHTDNGDLPQDNFQLKRGLNFGSLGNLPLRIFHICLWGSLLSLTSPISLIPPRSASGNRSIGFLLKWEIFGRGKRCHLAWYKVRLSRWHMEPPIIPSRLP